MRLLKEIGIEFKPAAFAEKLFHKAIPKQEMAHGAVSVHAHLVEAFDGVIEMPNMGLVFGGPLFSFNQGEHGIDELHIVVDELPLLKIGVTLFQTGSRSLRHHRANIARVRLQIVRQSQSTVKEVARKHMISLADMLISLIQ